MTQRIGTVKPKSFIGTSALVKELHGVQAITGTAPRHSGVVNPLPGGTVEPELVYDGGGSSAGVRVNADGTLESILGNIALTDTVTGTRWFTGTPDQTYQAYFEVSGINGLATGPNASWSDLPCQLTADNTGGNSSASVTFRIMIRRKSDGFVVATSSADYYAACSSTSLPSGG